MDTNNFLTVKDYTLSGYYPLSWNLFDNSHYQRKVKKQKKVKDKTFEIITIEEKLSDTSKIMYSIFTNQLHFSLKNGWYDEKGNLFVIFSIEKLTKILGKSRDTIIKCKRELEENDLIKVIGSEGKSDIFFIGKIKEKDGSEIQDFVDKTQKETKILSRYEIIEGLTKKEKSVDDVAVPNDDVDRKVIDNVDTINYIYNYNNITTTTENLQEENNENLQKPNTEKNSSSSLINFDFLKKYSGISNATRQNILKMFPNLTQEEFDKKFSLVRDENLKGNIKSFDAVLIKFLKGEWNIEVPSMQEQFNSDKDIKTIRRIVYDCLEYIQFGWSKKDLLEKLYRDTLEQSDYVKARAKELLEKELEKRKIA